MIKNLRNKKNKKGFTLIELIVVIAILAILALVLVPSISNYVGEANAAKNLSNVRSVHSQLAYDVAMAVKGEAGEDRWGYTVTNGVVEDTAEGGITTTADETGVPDGMVVTYTIDEGQLETFSATITNGATYVLNDAGQIEIQE